MSETESIKKVLFLDSLNHGWFWSLYKLSDRANIKWTEKGFELDAVFETKRIEEIKRVKLVEVKQMLQVSPWLEVTYEHLNTEKTVYLINRNGLGFPGDQTRLKRTKALKTELENRFGLND